MTTGTADIWHVKLENGEVRRLTLDELDAAYKDGWVRGRTPVLPAGAFRWSPLRDVAGLDPSGSYESLPISIAPQMVDLDVDFDSNPAKEEIAAVRPKSRAKAIFGVAIAIVAIGAISFAATRARPGLAMSAKAFVTSHLPGKFAPAAAAAAAPAKMEAPAPPAQPNADEVPPPPVTAAPTAAPVATMNVSALPTATAKGKHRKHHR